MKLQILFLLATIPSLAMSGKGLGCHSPMEQVQDCLGTTTLVTIKETNAYRILQRSDGTGYAIVQLRQGSPVRMLGWSLEGVWNEADLPPVLAEWLCRIDSVSVLPQGEANSLIIQPTEEKKTLAEEKSDVYPLLTCHWHQSSPYNDLSPVITDGNIKTAAGCVAIAAAQIAYYWRRDNPATTLKDTPTYPYGAAPVTMSIPKGSSNNWELMRDSYISSDSRESKYAAAQLCYVIGTTSYLNYASSTGGQINDAANALYSQYDIISDYAKKTNFTADEWEYTIYSEIAEGRPVMCAGGSDSGAHAFVLDGYNAYTGLYHFNFGWGGNGDGYYPIDDSDISMGGYSKGQSIVYGIHPNKRNIEVSMSTNIAEETDAFDITINIVNNSTLDVNSLLIYPLIPEGGTIGETDIPIWRSNAAISNDGVEKQIVARNISTITNQEYILCLTDEKKYILGTLSSKDVSGIEDIRMDNTSEAKRIYDTCGREVKRPMKGKVYLTRSGKLIIE